MGEFATLSNLSRFLAFKMNFVHLSEQLDSEVVCDPNYKAKYNADRDLAVSNSG